MTAPGPDEPITILVLCSGNIGRSPLAAALLRSALAAGLGAGVSDLEALGVVVESAGTDAPDGHAPSTRAATLAAERGLDLSGHRARTVTTASLERADLILCMDRQQISAVADIDPSAVSKTELLAGEGGEILDPHHRDDEFFRNVARQIDAAVEWRVPGLLETLRRHHE